MGVKVTITTRTTLAVEAAVFAVLGVLFFLGVSLDSIMNIALGIVFCLIAMIALIPMFVQKRSILNGEGIMSIFYLSIGVLCFVGNLIPIGKILNMLLIVAGVAFMLDGFLSTFQRRWKGVFNWVEFGFGIVSLVLGLLLWFGVISKALSYVLGGFFLVLAIIIIVNLIKTRERKAKRK